MICDEGLIESQGKFHAVPVVSSVVEFAVVEFDWAWTSINHSAKIINAFGMVKNRDPALLKGTILVDSPRLY